MSFDLIKKRVKKLKADNDHSIKNLIKSEVNSFDMNLILKVSTRKPLGRKEVLTTSVVNPLTFFEKKGKQFIDLN